MRIPFNKPYMTGRELERVEQAYRYAHLSGDGRFTAQCHAWLERSVGCARALLTHSCTGALEMAAILADLGPADEVIMPSFTFVSTANAVVLRGAVPVFVDIRPDTLNINEKLIEAAITARTRAIFVVHYAGVGCAKDAAQGIMARYRGRPLGSFGQLAAVSFHETKNIISGEGGALLVNDPQLAERAEIVREKGTDRSRFLRGEVDKYTWVDVGSSYLPSEIIAAFLIAQTEQAETITARRIALWERYHAAFAQSERAGRVRRPVVPAECEHNAHMYYLLLPSMKSRSAFIARMEAQDINCVFHYVPLHSSPAGRRYGRAVGELHTTDDASGRLVRLPLWVGLEEHFDLVADQALEAIRNVC
jgi:dTDP-4-amino-4,6-dideoxygalactose transaminase